MKKGPVEGSTGPLIGEFAMGESGVLGPSRRLLTLSTVPDFYLNPQLVLVSVAG
jgi:hypothetical protein